MTTTGQVNRGDRVTYDGKEAVVLKNRKWSDKIVLLIDGQRVCIDKDVFSITADLEKRIQKYDEQIEYNKEQIELYKDQHSLAKANIKNFRESMRSILKSCGVSHFNQISNEEQKAQYSAFREQNAEQTSIRNSATNNIIYYAHSTASAASGKIKALNAQAIAQHVSFNFLG